jgi:hypothetical protein
MKSNEQRVTWWMWAEVVVAHF